LSQYARVGPAILAPEMRMVVFLVFIMVLSFLKGESILLFGMDS
jgi:hypothetical protein